MGFGDFLKSAGGAVLNQMDKKKERITMYRDRADSYSDSELLSKIKYASGDEKQGYILAAKKRGLL